MKKYINISVNDAAKKRIAKSFDNFPKLYISFSGGKDSTVLFHMVMKEAVKRNRKVGVLIIDLEAQYKDTINNINRCIKTYEENIDLHWFCGEILLRNAVSNFEPKWVCWDETKKDLWIRDKPSRAADLKQYDFYQPRMEFEELMVIFGKWYADGDLTGAFIGIRSDESLHRYRAIVSNKTNATISGYKWTTKVSSKLFNLYPLYDWKTEDIWVYLGRNKELSSNNIYSKMSQAGVPLSQQRLCQPYGDDQKKGLWLYQLLEPNTWTKLLNRVSGVNSGALYIKERGNINGNHSVTKPDKYTWQEYTNFLLSTMPDKTRNNYVARFKKFIVGWKKRGYETIPDEAPHELEVKCWVPSWKRMARSILRNDYYCKGLGQTQPKSEAYQKFKAIQLKNRLVEKVKIKTSINKTIPLFDIGGNDN
jgi:predicted phosphoadenosine phosphosulfate sulfurtransferase